MTYRFTQGPERWKIAPLKFDQLSRWQLYHAVDEAWRGLRLFETAPAAMAAVATGQTGVTTWDLGVHTPADFAQDKWACEDW